MAIHRQTIKESMNSREDYRHRLAPFSQDESGIKALQSYFDENGKISRGGMYLLEIMNNIITANNDQENTRVFRRAPSQVRRGWDAGGSIYKKSALICRANGTERGTDARDGSGHAQEETSEGYTIEQTMLGSWAERDGCWSDTPEEDQKKAGRLPRPNLNGSESRIYFDDKKSKVYKTTDWSHYHNIEELLDKIAIHNTIFPETSLKVKGLGIREDAYDNTGFVLILEQQFYNAIRPANPQETAELLAERGMEQSTNGIFHVSRTNNFVITDVGTDIFADEEDEACPVNVVIAKDKENNEIAVIFDCDAFLKTFHISEKLPKKFSMSELAPDSLGRFSGKAWEEILGENYSLATNAEKSTIYKELRLTGKVEGTINGNIIKMISPIPRKTIVSGKEITYYDDMVSIGVPMSFRKDEVYTIPELEYDIKNVNAIKEEINFLLPKSMKLEDFLYSREILGQKAAYLGNAEFRKDTERQLKTYGRIEGLINGYSIQADREIPGNVIITNDKQLKFLVWATTASNEEGIHFSEKNKTDLASGKTILVGNNAYYFDTDRGKICQETNQKKLRLLQNQQNETSLRL